MVIDGARRPMAEEAEAAAEATVIGPSGGVDPADPVRPAADKSVKRVNRTCD